MDKSTSPCDLVASTTSHTETKVGVVHFHDILRCVITISIIRLAGAQGRLVFISLITGLLFGGPAISIVHNLYEVQETTECLGRAVQGQAEILKAAYTSAFKDISNTVAGSIKEAGDDIDSVFRPMKDGLTKAANAIRGFQQTVQATKDACGSAVDKVRNECESESKNAHEKCVSALSSFQGQLGSVLVGNGTVIVGSKDRLGVVGDGKKTVIGTAGNGVTDTFKKVINSVSSAAKKMGNDASDGSKKLANGVSGAAKTVGNAVLDSSRKLENRAAVAAKTMGHSVSGAAKKVRNGAKNFWNKIKGRKRRRRSPQDWQNICQNLIVGSAACSSFTSNVVCSSLQAVQSLDVDYIQEAVAKLVDLLNLSLQLSPRLEQTVSQSEDTSEILEDIRHKLPAKFGAISIVFRVIQSLFLIPILFVPLTTYLYLRKAMEKPETRVTKETEKQRRSDHRIILIHIFISFCILSFDFLLCDMQKGSRNDSGTNLTIAGALDINLNVKAVSALQPVVDKFMTTLQKERAYHFQARMSSTEACFPNPIPSAEIETILFITALYALLLCSFVFEVYIGRLKETVVLKFINGQMNTKTSENKESVGEKVEELAFSAIINK